LKSFSLFDFLRTLAVVRYLRLIKDDPKNKVHSSEEVAAIVFGKNGGSYRARTIRDWANNFCEYGKLPQLNQGKYQKTKALIDDEDVRIACIRFLRSTKPDQRNAATVMKWINENLSHPCEISYPLAVSERAARNWLVKLNFSYQDYKQGSHYINGHECPDVVSHRKSFVDEMALWQKRMETYEGSDNGNLYCPVS
jgi:hypothetical protein